jgi:release factor glutamine methyltransferase
MNLRQAIAAAAAQLAADDHLKATASRDAEFLLLYTVGMSRVTLLAYPERELTAEQQIGYEANVARRLRHEPIQYITGEQEFYGLTMKVTPAVLIPRPETELLVEAVLSLLHAGESLRIADVGTGSGAIAIALAVHLPHAEITALDVSTAALAVAEDNAREHGVVDRIRFLQSDLLSAVGAGAEAFDAIVSNPPYVAEANRNSLHPEVRDYEPASALFAGESGLDVYRRLIPEALPALNPGGLLALEIGQGQEAAIGGLLERWDHVSFLKDLQSIPRVGLARRPARDGTIR